MYMKRYLTLVILPLLFAVSMAAQGVKYYDESDGHPYVRLRTKEVRAGWTARLILRLWGYMFLHSFVKPKVSAEDVNAYQHRFSLEDGWNAL